MQKLETLSAAKTFRIVHYANGDDLLFFEPANRIYFQSLLKKHLRPVCEILRYELKPSRIELILKFHELAIIPEKYREKLHLPLSNLFNSYAKSINQRYDRKGSLFRTRFERKEILT